MAMNISRNWNIPATQPPNPNDLDSASTPSLSAHTSCSLSNIFYDCPLNVSPPSVTTNLGLPFAFNVATIFNSLFYSRPAPLSLFHHYPLHQSQCSSSDRVIIIAQHSIHVIFRILHSSSATSSSSLLIIRILKDLRGRQLVS